MKTTFEVPGKPPYLVIADWPSNLALPEIGTELQLVFRQNEVEVSRELEDLNGLVYVTGIVVRLAYHRVPEGLGARWSTTVTVR